MSAIVVNNTVEADDDFNDVPLKDGGEPYQFEMLFNGLVDRAYADHATDLIDCLIPRYAGMTEGERLAARLQHAVRTQTTVQAYINWRHNNLVGCTDDQVRVLTSTRSIPPSVMEWSSEVPLVLVDVFYRPLGQLPAPLSTIADVDQPPNLLWLRASDEYDYLISLADLGFIELNIHSDYRP